MALRAVPDHPKFAALKSLLSVPKHVALGILETLWHFAGRYTPQGNVGKYTDSEIEAWLEWGGAESGLLIQALVDSRWVDRDSRWRLLIHDWPTHADKATKQALNRSKLEFCVPTVHTPGAHNDVLSTLPVPVPESVPVPDPVPVGMNASEIRKQKVTEILARELAPIDNRLTVEELETAWERHRKHRNDQPMVNVFRMVHAQNGTLDSDKFRERHPRWCEYWNQRDWSFCPLTLWEWIEQGMPHPPASVPSKEEQKQESRSDRQIRIMKERAAKHFQQEGLL